MIITSTPSLVTAVISVLFISMNSAMGSPLTSISTLGSNFTLAALNTTLPNANCTGAPLVLGEAGAIDGESFHVSSTYNSYPYNDFPSLGLVNGNLRAFDKEGNWNTNASAPSLGSSGEMISWGTSSFYSSPASTAFSAVTITPASRFPVLAVNGVYNMWYLCPSDERLGQDSVYFNTTSIPSSKMGSPAISCYSILLNVVSSS